MSKTESLCRITFIQSKCVLDFHRSDKVPEDTDSRRKGFFWLISGNLAHGFGAAAKQHMISESMRSELLT